MVYASARRTRPVAGDHAGQAECHSRSRTSATQSDTVASRPDRGQPSPSSRQTSPSSAAPPGRRTTSDARVPLSRRPARAWVFSGRVPPAGTTRARIETIVAKNPRTLTSGRHSASPGVTSTTHTLRHVAASTMIAANVGGSERNTIEMVSDQMLHADTKVTRRVYQHPIAVDRRHLAKLMSQQMTGLMAEPENLPAGGR